MNKSNRSFKNYLIYPQFQLRLLFLMMSLVMICPVSLFIFQYLAFNFLKARGIENSWPETHPYFVYMQQFQDMFYLILASSIFVGVILSIIFGILISHKVSGPLVKMIKAFDQAVEDPATAQAITFRKGDFFQELADSYNRRFKK